MDVPGVRWRRPLAGRRPPSSRVAAAHCCAAAPSEPGVRRFDAPGSSKPSVKIRCRSRRTPSSTRRQATASQSTTSPSGPFTSTVSNLPIGSSVSVHLFFTGSPDPRQLPFGPGNTPVSDQLGGIHPAEVPVTRFPVSCRRFGCRPSLLGSSCARWGVAPSSRSAYRRRSAGPQRGCRVAHEQDPTGQGALLTPGTVVRSRPATILRPAPAALLRPVPIPRCNIPSAGLTFTRRHRGFTHVRPSPPGGWLPPTGRERHRFPPVFSSPAAPEWNESRFGFYPGLRTPRLPTTHAEAETGHRALTRVLHLRNQSNLNGVQAPRRRRVRCAPRQPEGFHVAVDDHDVARDVAVWPLRAVNLDDDVGSLLSRSTTRDEPLKKRRTWSIPNCRSYQSSTRTAPAGCGTQARSVGVVVMASYLSNRRHHPVARLLHGRRSQAHKAW